MENDRQKWIITVCIGLCAGTISALLILYLLQMTGFSMKGSSYLCMMIVSFFLPWCLNWSKKWVISVRITQWIMVGVHAVITVLYAFTVASSGTQLNLLLSAGLTGVMEGISVLVLYLENIISKHNK